VASPRQSPKKTTSNPELAPEEYPAPLIVPRPDHPISRKKIDRDALKVMHRLRDAGHIAYLVGGGVRDIYLGRSPKDFDISTDASPAQLKKIFKNSRIIGRRFRLVQVFFRGGKIIEVSTFRRRNVYNDEDGEQVLAANNTFGSTGEDAFRRDLTINSLFYEINDFSIIDFTGGVQDLKDSIIRIIGEPEKRIIRDPVRMLRAIRHAARCGFKIEEKTWQAILAHKEKLTLCPVSRIRDELFKDLKAGSSMAWIRLMLESGVLGEIFPCYKKLLKKNSPEYKKCEQLDKIFSVVDRIHATGQILPEQMLMGLLLIPWAELTFELLAPQEGMKNAYSLSRKIRAELNDVFIQLNISKAMKEAVAGFLANLPVFIKHEESESWPKWLKKKSYFKASSQFYKIYNEATGGEQVEFISVPTIPASKFRKTSGRRGGRGIAYSKKKKGGVFGFKKQ
jgi:poly(A) polymerase